MMAEKLTKSKLRQVAVLLLGLIVFVIMGIGLEYEAGLPFETTYRIGCAVVCCGFIYKLVLEYPGEHWLRVGFWFALIVNTGLFFTPFLYRAASRGEIMIFALPDAVALLAVGLAYYPANDTRQRAVRQQMILGLTVAVIFCATLFGLALPTSYTVR